VLIIVTLAAICQERWFRNQCGMKDIHVSTVPNLGVVDVIVEAIFTLAKIYIVNLVLFLYL